jgi:hypothetical protein
MVKHELNPTKVLELSVGWDWLIPRKVIQHPGLCWVLPLPPSTGVRSSEVPSFQEFKLRNPFQVFRSLEILFICSLLLLNNLIILGKLESVVVPFGQSAVNTPNDSAVFLQWQPQK